MNKQTALQWFLDKLPHSIETQFSEQIQEALQMEREHIVDAYVECWMNDGGNPFHKVKENAEQYYNETYGGQDE